MKQLFLIRHAKSSWDDPQCQDRDRPLNPRGERQLPPLAHALAHCGAFSGTVYASDAVRARRTLEGILPGDLPAQRVQVCPELYTFDYRRLLHWLQRRDDPQDTLALVGHNPALLELAAPLRGQPLAKLPTASFVEIRLPVSAWRELGPGQGRLERLLTPRDFSYAQFARKQRKHPDNPSSLPATLTHLLAWMRRLEPGIRTGLDDEFLHQYRVAIRRSRALAEALLDVTPNPTLARSVRHLRQHARATSRLRDLHVFLAELATWDDTRGTAPPALSAWLRAEADRAHRRFVHRLDGRRYHDHLDEWQRLIESGRFRRLSEQLDARAIRQAVARRIRTFNRHTVELLHTAPDEDIHRLRKQLKRIRYLMELNPEHWRDRLKALRQRQELYGRFQDRHVQIEWLDSFRAQAPAELVAATAPLRGRLSRDKTAIRRQILAQGGLL